MIGFQETTEQRDLQAEAFGDLNCGQSHRYDRGHALQTFRSQLPPQHPSNGPFSKTSLRAAHPADEVQRSGSLGKLPRGYNDSQPPNIEMRHPTPDVVTQMEIQRHEEPNIDFNLVEGLRTQKIHNKPTKVLIQVLAFMISSSADSQIILAYMELIKDKNDGKPEMNRHFDRCLTILQVDQATRCRALDLWRRCVASMTPSHHEISSNVSSTGSTPPSSITKSEITSQVADSLERHKQIIHSVTQSALWDGSRDQQTSFTQGAGYAVVPERLPNLSNMIYGNLNSSRYAHKGDSSHGKTENAVAAPYIAHDWLHCKTDKINDGSGDENKHWMKENLSYVSTASLTRTGLLTSRFAT